MPTPDPPSVEGLLRDARSVRARLESIADRGGAELPGAADVLRGLGALVEELAREDRERERDDRARLEVLLRGVRAVADALSPRPKDASDRSLDRFIGSFRAEASRQLDRAAIAMMDAQSGDPESIERVAAEMHAIRGAAAMLGLEGVAEIAGAMEQLALLARRADPSAWPSEALTSGRRALESAIAAEDARPEEGALAEARAALSDALGERTEPAQSVGAPPPEEGAQVETEQRILVVDDAETIAASIGFVLGELGAPIDLAVNGQEALAALRRRPYSLVISDVAMPRMDGIALAEMMREDPDLAGIPIVLLTSLDHPDEREAGLAAGAADYIIKGSVGGAELIERVRALLDIAPFVPVEAPEAARPRVLVAEDAETVAASIAFLLSHDDVYDVVIASDGDEALTRLERERFDLLMSDWQMPKMSGEELTRAVRASTRIRPLPIILLTSIDSGEHRALAKKAGADRYLLKGEVGGGALLGVVAELLAAASSARQEEH